MIPTESGRLNPKHKARGLESCSQGPEITHRAKVFSFGKDHTEPRFICLKCVLKFSDTKLPIMISSSFDKSY